MLYFNSLHSSAINLFRKAVPPSVSIDFMAPYLQIISRYNIEAVSSAVVDLQGKASAHNVVESTTTNK